MESERKEVTMKQNNNGTQQARKNRKSKVINEAVRLAKEAHQNCMNQGNGYIHCEGININLEGLLNDLSSALSGINPQINEILAKLREEIGDPAFKKLSEDVITPLLFEYIDELKIFTNTTLEFRRKMFDLRMKNYESIQNAKYEAEKERIYAEINARENQVNNIIDVRSYIVNG